MKYLYLPDYYEPKKALELLKEYDKPITKLKFLEAILHYLVTRTNHYKSSERHNGFDGWIQLGKEKRKCLLSHDNQSKLYQLFDGILWDVKKTHRGEYFYLMGKSKLKFKLKPYEKIKKVKAEYDRSKLLSKVRYKHFDQESAAFKHVAEQTDKLRLRTDEDSINSISQILKDTYPDYFKDTTPNDWIEDFNEQNTIESFVDGFGNRLHTSLTSMKSTLRPYLYFEGKEERLAMLDIKNSQPYFLGNITASFIGTYLPECKEVIPLLQDYKSQADYKLFSKLTREGSIYEYFQKLMKQSYDYELEREYIKKFYMYLLFTNYNWADDNQERNFTTELVDIELLDKAEVSVIFKSQIYSVFKREFPSVYGFIKDVRNLNWDFNHSKNKNYTNNCLLLQRAEAALFFNVIVPALLKHGVTQLSTIHDSILVEEKNVKKVKQIMVAAIKEVGLALPQISIETYGS